MEDEDLVLSVAHVLVENLLVSWYNCLFQYLHLLRIQITIGETPVYLHSL
jgi:hypothetical protein